MCRDHKRGLVQAYPNTWLGFSHIQQQYWWQWLMKRFQVWLTESFSMSTREQWTSSYKTKHFWRQRWRRNSWRVFRGALSNRPPLFTKFRKHLFRNQLTESFTNKPDSCSPMWRRIYNAVSQCPHHSTICLPFYSLKTSCTFLSEVTADAGASFHEDLHMKDFKIPFM